MLKLARQMMSGYPAVAVDCSLKPGLSCLHCEFFLREPVQTEEGLRICKPCFQEIQSLAGGTCDDCGVTSSGICYPDKAVQREVFSLLVYCSHKKNGCQWQGPIKEWESHCSDCEFKGSPCPNEGCTTMLPQMDMEHHKEECQFRLVSCQHCSMGVPCGELQNHHAVCEQFPVICTETICATTFMRKNMLEHMTHQCKVVTCHSCAVKVYRDNGVEIIPEDDARLDCPLSQRERIISTPPSSVGVEEPASAYRGCPAGAQGSSSLPLSCPPDPGVHPLQPPGPRVHLSDPLQNFRHHQSLAENLQELERGVASISNMQRSVAEKSAQSMQGLKAENLKLNSELKALKCSISDITSAFQKLRVEVTRPLPDPAYQGKLEALARADSEQAAVALHLKRELADLQNVVETLRRKTEQGLTVVHQDGFSSIRGREPALAKSLTSRVGDVGVASDSRLLAAEKRVEELAKQLGLVRIHGQELELQLQASLASTHNGAFLWRIPEVSRRRRDAVDERVTSIYSPPFYTGRNGYKMCIRAYLNGDGMGYKTHLSLFFVLMKGECDPLLKWPFEFKISMILVDQTHRKHVVQTFKPTPDSTSFHQPTSDMNVASGCPQFAKLTMFNDDSYVKNDVMFVKCIVDTTKIFHP